GILPSEPVPVNPSRGESACRSRAVPGAGLRGGGVWSVGPVSPGDRLFLTGTVGDAERRLCPDKADRPHRDRPQTGYTAARGAAPPAVPLVRSSGRRYQ